MDDRAEGEDDEKQKEWCETEFDTSEDKEGELKRKIAGLGAAIEEMSEGIAALKDDIAALKSAFQLSVKPPGTF